MSVKRTTKGSDTPQQDGSAQAAAEYIAGMTADLAAIARRHKLPTLGYFLEMAQLEAQLAVEKTRSTNNGHVQPPAPPASR